MTTDTDKMFSDMGVSRHNKVIDDGGVAHYAVIVDKWPEFIVAQIHTTAGPPFLVKPCDFCDALDRAASAYAFRYPTWTAPIDAERDGYPTCAACSSA
jgi:hypothetical protein